MKKFARIMLAAVLIVWIIAPDLIPGPVDDVIALLLAISDIKSIGQASDCA